MAASAAKLLHGVIPALVSPFKSDEDGGGVDTDAVAPLIEHLLDASDPVNGFYLTGNTGEGFAMTADERKTLATKVVEVVAGRVPVVVHVGAAGGTEASCDLAKHAESIGATATSSVVPTDKPGDFDAALEHFKAVGAACELPFYVYWVGANADKRVTPEQFLEKMEYVPHFSGAKFTDTNFFLFQRLNALAPDKNWITGPDEMNVAGMVMGSDGAIGSTYNMMPKIFLRMRRHFEAGEIREAMALQAQANEVIACLMRNCEIGEKGKVNIVEPCKLMMNRAGVKVGHARERSARRLTEEQERNLFAELDAMDFKVE